MASLKDMRVRIASTKATQKITKAMQMVAAAKLRRAQEAAEAARPYSQRMGAVLANIAANTGGDDAPRLMTGTGKEEVHLLLVCTAERGLCEESRIPDVNHTQLLCIRITNGQQEARFGDGKGAVFQAG